jgi:hypothetical protein
VNTKFTLKDRHSQWATQSEHLEEIHISYSEAVSKCTGRVTMSHPSSAIVYESSMRLSDRLQRQEHSLVEFLVTPHQVARQTSHRLAMSLFDKRLNNSVSDTVFHG